MRSIALLPLLLIATPAVAAPVALGQYARWGAFRADRPPRCYAIAQPADGKRDQALAIVLAPGDAPHVRLITGTRPLRDVRLRIGGQDFGLPAAQHDQRRLIAAFRHADSVTTEGRDLSSRRVRATYLLAGAPSAIDAAILGCLG